MKKLFFSGRKNWWNASHHQALFPFSSKRRINSSVYWTFPTLILSPGKLPCKLQKGLPANLFLKHLMVLANISGERLKRLRFGEIFPTGSMKYSWRGQVYEYKFEAITKRNTISNSSLAVDGKKLTVPYQLDSIRKDTAMLILYGAASTEARIPDEIMEKCVIGSLIGHHDELMKFVKERYIWVSQITGGARANAMGQLAQNYVLEICTKFLPDWTFRRDSTIPGITHNEGATETNFDIVATSPSGKYTAVEVCFQVTTNSVIERKGGQAQARFQLLRSAGHRIAYVIDGAGNFERRAALSNICRYSDCTVALSLEELKLSAQFLRDFEQGKLP